MEHMDDALIAQRRGNEQTAHAAFRQAFQFERAAELLLNLPDQPEPSRSVLLRSAASLARDAGECAEAVRLIRLALSGEPPAEIADDLQTLLAELSDELAGGGSDEQAAHHTLLAAQRFAEAVGGIERARESLDALSRLGS
jgi:hypothetical protein